MALLRYSLKQTRFRNWANSQAWASVNEYHGIPILTTTAALQHLEAKTKG